MTADDTCKLPVPTIRRLSHAETVQIDATGECGFRWFMSCTLREVGPYMRENVGRGELLDTMLRLALVAVCVRVRNFLNSGEISAGWLESLDDPLSSGVVLGWRAWTRPDWTLGPAPSALLRQLHCRVDDAAPGKAGLDELLRQARMRDDGTTK